MKLLEQVRQACRMKHYSPRTEESYARWIVRFLWGNSGDAILYSEPEGTSFVRCPRNPSGDRSRCPKARHLLHVPPLLRHAPPGSRLRHSHGPGASRAQGSSSDDDLHPRDAPARRWGDEPPRCAAHVTNRTVRQPVELSVGTLRL